MTALHLGLNRRMTNRRGPTGVHHGRSETQIGHSPTSPRVRRKPMHPGASQQHRVMESLYLHRRQPPYLQRQTEPTLPLRQQLLNLIQIHTKPRQPIMTTLRMKAQRRRISCSISEVSSTPTTVPEPDRDNDMNSVKWINEHKRRRFSFDIETGSHNIICFGSLVVYWILDMGDQAILTAFSEQWIQQSGPDLEIEGL
jgi:hypothetical protein